MIIRNSVPRREIPVVRIRKLDTDNVENSGGYGGFSQPLVGTQLTELALMAACFGASDNEIGVAGSQA